MGRWFSYVGLLLISMNMLVACSGDDESEETTTTTAAQTTTVETTTQEPASTVSLAPAGGDTTTSIITTTVATLGGVEFPSYSIEERIEGEAGDTLVILIDPDFDDALTDIDLQQLLSEVVDEFAPVREAYVVSSEEAAAIVLLDDISVAQQAVLDQHFWARLEEGFRILFEGPFAGEAPLLISS